MNFRRTVQLLMVAALIAAASVLAFKPNVAPVSWLPLTNNLRLGLDLQGGVHVVLEAVDTPEAPVTAEGVRQAMAVLENRINQFGVVEPVIQQQGARRIIVELAGIKDPEEAVQTLIKPAYLEFKNEEGEVIVTGRDLQDAREAKDPQSGEVEVSLTFTPVGARKFAEATTEATRTEPHKHIGIYLDGQLLQNPQVKEPIPSGKARITGYSSLEEAHRMAVLLRSGALPVKLEIVEKRTVGPTLGSDSLASSVKAGILGLGAILIFMIGYYRAPGVMANLALCLYMVLVLIIYTALKVTMTLPGIAGFLLSLGMAVDANIIIFERLKEELRAGRTLKAAIDVGFRRAFVAVFDANMTTVLAAAVLYYLGTGPVRGFAVTLTIGILTSMFTAVTVSRWLLHLLAGTGLVKNLKLYGA
ncbi:MAG: protein translocase subunit SecD [Firmicutes bacterium]|nr:protein translocase subunit SecD [Bacillota bacterium]